MCNLYCFVLQVFEGNNDATTIVTHRLNSTERARFVRFYPTAYETNACIQVELYGHEIVKSKLVKLQTELFSLELELNSWLSSLTFERRYTLYFRS
jgi:cob(I)alamin adenosyltransferase